MPRHDARPKSPKTWDARSGTCLVMNAESLREKVMNGRKVPNMRDESSVEARRPLMKVVVGDAAWLQLVCVHLAISFCFGFVSWYEKTYHQRPMSWRSWVHLALWHKNCNPEKVETLVQYLTIVTTITSSTSAMVRDSEAGSPAPSTATVSVTVISACGLRGSKQVGIVTPNTIPLGLCPQQTLSPFRP
jgi:hypothetical protein